MCVCEVSVSCAYELYLFTESLSFLCNLILHVMSTAVSSIKKMQTANKSAITGKLASSGQLLWCPTIETGLELGVVLLVKLEVDTVVTVGATVVVGS